MEQTQTVSAPCAGSASGSFASGFASGAKAPAPAPQIGQRSGGVSPTPFQLQTEQTQTVSAPCGAPVCALSGVSAAGSAVRSAAAPAPQTGQAAGLSAPVTDAPQTRHIQFFSILFPPDKCSVARHSPQIRASAANARLTYSL